MSKDSETAKDKRDLEFVLWCIESATEDGTYYGNERFFNHRKDRIVAEIKDELSRMMFSK